MNLPTFEHYADWHDAITRRCGLKLDRAYCESRIEALADPSIPSTRAFLDAYGPAYRDRIVLWFRRALEEA